MSSAPLWLSSADIAQNELSIEFLSDRLLALAMSMHGTVHEMLVDYPRPPADTLPHRTVLAAIFALLPGAELRQESLSGGGWWPVFVMSPRGVFFCETVENGFDVYIATVTSGRPEEVKLAREGLRVLAEALHADIPGKEKIDAALYGPDDEG